ncbi:MAG TPA: hypothetical protein VF587_13375 [Solirubrobacteraceae bacterium]
MLLIPAQDPWRVSAKALAFWHAVCGGIQCEEYGGGIRMTRTGPQGREPSADELRALADHAAQRVALYRRKMYVGGGTATRLAELEREAHGASDRLARATTRETT